jgi:hypothetical protein
MIFKVWIGVFVATILGGILYLSYANPWTDAGLVTFIIVWGVFSVAGIALSYDDENGRVSKERCREIRNAIAKWSLIALVFGILCYGIGNYHLDIPSVSEYIPSVTVERKES